MSSPANANMVPPASAPALAPASNMNAPGSTNQYTYANRGKGKGGKGGLGKHMSKRHRNAESEKDKNPVLKISNTKLRQLGKRAAARRFSADVFPEVRAVAKAFVDEIMSNAEKYCDNRRKRTITVADVVYAIKRMKENGIPYIKDVLGYGTGAGGLKPR